MKKINYPSMPFSSRTYGRFILLCLIFIGYEMFRFDGINTAIEAGTAYQPVILTSVDMIIDLIYFTTLFFLAVSNNKAIKIYATIIIILTFVKAYWAPLWFLRIDAILSITLLCFIMGKSVDEYLKEDYYGIFKSH